MSTMQTAAEQDGEAERRAHAAYDKVLSCRAICLMIENAPAAVEVGVAAGVAELLSAAADELEPLAFPKHRPADG